MKKRICGFTFTMYPSCLGTFYDEYTRESMRRMKEDTGCNAVTIAFMALQETAFSEEIALSQCCRRWNGVSTSFHNNSQKRWSKSGRIYQRNYELTEVKA